MRKNKYNNKGFILIETAIFIIIISFMCSSLALFLGNQIINNKNDKINQNLYLTAKSTINILSQEFSEKEHLLKKYANQNEEGIFKIDGRDDIDSIKVKVYNNSYKTAAILEVTVFDNLKNELTLLAEIYY